MRANTVGQEHGQLCSREVRDGKTSKNGGGEAQCPIIRMQDKVRREKKRGKKGGLKGLRDEYGKIRSTCMTVSLELALGERFKGLRGGGYRE